VSDKQPPVFSRAVVALNGGPSDQRILRVVLDLAKPAKAEIVAVHVVAIDWTMPLDASVAEISEDAQRVLDLAEAQAERAGYRLESVLVQARDVGAALVDEAVERDADLLVLGLPYRTKFGGDFAIGRAVPYVLKNAPCAVWVAREPMPEEQRP
jgi:nucleotide-binding universal stress UspA family protein